VGELGAGSVRKEKFNVDLGEKKKVPVRFDRKVEKSKILEFQFSIICQLSHRFSTASISAVIYHIPFEILLNAQTHG
jgi:hypothetical protein